MMRCVGECGTPIWLINNVESESLRGVVKPINTVIYCMLRTI